MDLHRLAANLNQVRTRISEAATRSGRPADSVRLVAVTKQSTIAQTRALASLGQLDLGENYPQELWHKAEALADLPVRWHLIGHLQTNKAARTAPRVCMIHAVDSLKLLRTLDALSLQPAPVVCLQVNCSAESTKHGWSPQGILDDASEIAACSRVQLAGLMTMAAWFEQPEHARPAFRQLRETRNLMQHRLGLPLPELSMGMSNDFEIAIEEGATWIRVGSALWEGVGL